MPYWIYYTFICVPLATPGPKCVPIQTMAIPTAAAVKPLFFFSIASHFLYLYLIEKLV